MYVEPNHDTKGVASRMYFDNKWRMKPRNWFEVALWIAFAVGMWFVFN